MRESLGPLGAPQYEEYCTDIHNSGTQLLNAINDILDIVKSESADENLDAREIELGELAGQIVQSLSVESDSNNIAITNEVPLGGCEDLGG